MNKKKPLKPERKPESEEPEQPESGKRTDAGRYIYDKNTGKWKMVNPSGSIAYNCLTRDEWGWLD